MLPVIPIAITALRVIGTRVAQSVVRTAVPVVRKGIQAAATQITTKVLPKSKEMLKAGAKAIQDAGVKTANKTREIYDKVAKQAGETGKKTVEQAQKTGKEILEKAKEVKNTVRDGVKKIPETMTKYKVAERTGDAVTVAGTAGTFYKNGQESSEISNTFEQFTKQLNIDSKQYMSELKSATGAAISEKDLKAYANEGFYAGMNTEEIKTVLSYLRKEADNSGRNLGNLYENLLNAIETGSTEKIEKVLGIKVEFGEIPEGLSQADRADLLIDKITETMHLNMPDLKDKNTAIDKIVTNFQDKFNSAAEIFFEFVNSFKDRAEGLFGSGGSGEGQYGAGPFLRTADSGGGLQREENPNQKTQAAKPYSLSGKNLNFNNGNTIGFGVNLKASDLYPMEEGTGAASENTDIEEKSNEANNLAESIGARNKALSEELNAMGKSKEQLLDEEFASLLKQAEGNPAAEAKLHEYGKLREEINTKKQQQDKSEVTHGLAMEGYGAVSGKMGDALSGLMLGEKVDAGALVKDLVTTLKVYAAQKTAHLILEAAFNKIMAFVYAKNNPALAESHATAATAAMTGIPIMAAIVAGFSAGGLIGQAHDGWMDLPETGTYYLKKGESVIDESTTQMMKKGQLGGSGMNMNVNIYGGDEQGVRRALPELERVVIAAVTKNISSNGEIRKSIKQYV